MEEEGSDLYSVVSLGSFHLEDDDRNPVNEEIRKIFKFSKLGESDKLRKLLDHLSSRFKLENTN